MFKTLSDLDHVVERLLVLETETLPDVQHVDFRARNHEPDQSVVRCAKTLKIPPKKYVYLETKQCGIRTNQTLIENRLKSVTTVVLMKLVLSADTTGTGQVVTFMDL